MTKKWSILFCLMATLCFNQVYGTEPSWTWLNTSLSISERVTALLAEMTLEEKVGQMTQIANFMFFAQNLTALQGEQPPNIKNISRYFLGSILSAGGGVPQTGNTPALWADMIDEYQGEILNHTRLKIPLIYGVDSVHGHGNLYGSTIFPHNIGLGAINDENLMRRIGEITAIETKATGIPWIFSPCLAVAQNERWGRTYESYSEDPEIVRNMGRGLIQGMQNNSVVACAKHWVGDGGTTNGTDQGNTEITLEQLTEIHMSPYLDALDAKVKTIMVSYSSFNGLKMHANKELVTNKLKGELGFKGFIIGDWRAHEQTNCAKVEHLCNGTAYCKGVELTINAGVDMAMVPDRMYDFTSCLIELVSNNNVTMDRINDAVSRILTVKMEIGLFENPWAQRELIPLIGKPEHRDVARDAVRRSLVLLKNDDSCVLPLNPTTNKIVVTGFSAHDIGMQCGGWTKTWQGMKGNITKGVTIYEGIRDYVPNSVIVELDENPTDPVIADVVIVVVGEEPYAEFVGDDLNNLRLTAQNIAIIKHSCSDSPCVVVIVAGRPLIITDDLINNDKVNAVVMAWLPGTEGDGVAQVLFNNNYDFEGRLPMTWPETFSQIPINDVGLGYGKVGKKFLYSKGYALDKNCTIAFDTSHVRKVENNISVFLTLAMILLAIY